MNLDDRMEQQIARMQVRQREKRIAAEAERRDRRERIATAALAGMLADRLTEEPAAVEYAKRAVKFADALIAELDKEVKP